MNTLVKEFKYTMSFLYGHKVQYCIGIIGKTIVEASAVLLEAYLLKLFLDVGKPESMGTIFRILAAVVIYVATILLLSPLFTFWFNGNAKYGHGNVNKAIYHKYGKLTEATLEKTHSGELMSLFLNDTWIVATIFMRHFRRVVASLITIVIYMIPMLVLDWRITIIMVSLNILTLLVNSKVAKYLKGTTKNIQEKMEDMTSSITNMISGMSVIRIYQQTRQMQKKFSDNNDTIASLDTDRAKVSSSLAAYNYAINILNMIVFLLLGSFMVHKGITTFGAILSIMSLQTAMDANFREFGTYYPEFIQGLASTERVYEFLHQEEEPERWGNLCSIENRTKNLKLETNYITFEHVDFSYDHTTSVLSDFTMTIKKGEHVALVGESGSGKSSIAKLLLGFYPIDAGRIAINGVDCADMPLKDWRSQIAYVPQEPAIFATTIMENIRYGNITATDEEVIEAAKKADAYHFIMEQENGFQTQTGENGVKLSGGQKQRISFARAILEDAPILLLDEATSALDQETEDRILDIMKENFQNKTIISIAHRKSTIENADRIISLGK